VQAEARSGRAPQWLVVLIAVVGTLAIIAAAVVYVRGDGHKRSNGRAPGTGPGAPLSASTINGAARSVQTAGRIRVDLLRLDLGNGSWNASGSGAQANGTGALTIEATGMSVDVFRTIVALDHVTFAPTAPDLSLPDGAVVNGEALHGKDLRLHLTTTDPIEWLDAPPTLVFENAPEFSWAGSGEIAVAGQHLTGEFLGGFGSMTLTLTRAADAITVTGSGGLQQAFVDGQPALRTTATIDRLRANITMHAGDTNDRTYVTWAPHDTGPFAMCMVKISPRSGHAEWVNIGLQHLPPMFGGEQHPPVGGDTSGMGGQGRVFGGADAIDSLIVSGTADRRDLSLSVPADTPPGVYPVEITVEGNFDPVVFSMSVTVAA
jgi:hypothetical protein